MYRRPAWTSLNEAKAGYTVNLLLNAVLLLTVLTGCSGIPISYYDATTYTQLTALKAETTLLVESFDTKPVADNEDNIANVTLSLRKAYEYELGKGEPNSDTAKQFKLITNLFNEDVENYRENGPGALGKQFFREASMVLGQAFDIAIATENLKNKDKR
ncbi:hypothetical protein [Kaarinaea lacus]